MDPVIASILCVVSFAAGIILGIHLPSLGSSDPIKEIQIPFTKPSSRKKTPKSISEADIVKREKNAPPQDPS